MITIQIKDWNWEVLFTIQDFFSLSISESINQSGTLNLSFPTKERMRKQKLQKGWRISVYYWFSLTEVIQLFDGFISGFTLNSDHIYLEATNWIGYLQYRMLRTTKNYSTVTIKTIIQQCFEELNQTSRLPFLLGQNTCETPLTRDFIVGSSFFDVLKAAEEVNPKLCYRMKAEGDQIFLEVWEGIGEIIPWVWVFDSKDPTKTNIVKWERKDSMDNFFNFISTPAGNLTNQEHVDATGLLFEKNETDEQKKRLPESSVIPTLTISRDTDWRKFNVGDRKHIKLITGYERLTIDYLWIIQTRNLSITPGGIKVEIKVSDKYREETNILDLMLKKIKK